MAEDDDKKIVETESIRQAKREIEELERAIKAARDTAEEREKERLLNYEALKKASQQEVEDIETRIEAYESEARARSGVEAKLLQEKADSLKKVLQIVEDGNETELESYRNLMDKKIEENNRFLNAFGRVREGLRGAFDDIDAGALKAMGAALGLLGLFGAKAPKFGDMFSEFAVSLDDARRSIVPFATSIKDANILQNQFKDISATTQIPITELGDTVGSAAGQFRMFALMTQGAQANLVGFHAQMKNMGVETGSSIIESLMSDSGVQSSDDAIDIFKALTVQMKELGVMPQTLASDYNKLIGTFAMFGDAAGMNIAKVSYQAQKAKVDTGAITGFADNFKGYSDAGRTAQTINAIFGRKIIDNPAELVSVFYTGGPAAALELVKRKIVSSGIDIEEMLGGAAGAARLQMLAQLGFGSAQAAKRVLTTDTTISPGDQASLDSAMEGGPPGQNLQARFDALAQEMLTQQERLNQMNEQLATELFERAGFSLGEFGIMFDGMLETVRKGFFDKGGLLDQFSAGLGKVIPGLGGVDPDTGEMKGASIKDVFTNLKGLSTEQSKLNAATREATTSQNNLIEELKRLNNNNDAKLAILQEEMKAQFGVDTTSSEGMAVKLVVNGTEMNAYLKGAIDRIAKGRA